MIKAEDMFKEDKEYVEFNEKGIPTKMKDDKGEVVEVTKSKAKKLQKEWDTRKKLNEKYAQKQ